MTEEISVKIGNRGVMIYGKWGEVEKSKKKRSKFCQNLQIFGLKSSVKNAIFGNYIFYSQNKDNLPGKGFIFTMCFEKSQEKTMTSKFKESVNISN